MVAGDLCSGTRADRRVPLVPQGVRNHLAAGDTAMLIYVTIAVTAFVFLYLIVALVRPERF
jgi:K+-transporting ATPase KdpF subunit